MAKATRTNVLFAGVLGPLVLAYLVHRSRAHSEPTADKVLDVLERHGLIDLESNGRLLRSRKDKPLLAEAREDGQDGRFLPQLQGRLLRGGRSQVP